jgi:hypothetical protein
MQKMYKLFLLAIVLFLTATTCQSQSAQDGRSKSRPAKSIVYTNKQYRFKFYLPKSWKGYSIIVSEWCGGVWEPTSDEAGGTQATRTERGPEITIRHPLWTEANPRQDIPIMVLTLAQGELADKGILIVSAAPFGPGEIGRNSRYVFALPPRFNYADVIGVEEVNNIIFNDPLHGF